MADSDHRLGSPSREDIESQTEEAFRGSLWSAIEEDDSSGLVLLLRGKDRPPRDFLESLANLFDPQSNSEHFAQITRRRRGRPLRDADDTGLQSRLTNRQEWLARLLRERGLGSIFLRRWLADLFDPGATSEFRAKIRRRRAGKPGRANQKVILAAHDVIANADAKSKLEALIALAIEKHSTPSEPIAETTVRDFLKSHWPGFAQSFREAKRRR